MNESSAAVEPHVPHPWPAVLAGLADAAVIVDSQLRPLAWNPAYTELVGLGAKRLAREAVQSGVRCRDLFALEVCDGNCLARQTFETARTVRMHELQGLGVNAKDATPQILIVNTIPIESDGRVDAVLEIYRNVTAEVNIQERYKVLLASERQRAELLEQEVQARTADLQRSLAQLQEARAQLIQSEKLSMLGRLIAGIAHEINNPVNFIYGNVDFLERNITALLRVIEAQDATAASPEQRASVEKVKQEHDYEYVREDLEKLVRSIRIGAERVATIVRDLRGVAHQGGDEMTAVCLAECIDRTVTILAHELRDKITLARNYPPELPTVWANEGRLAQVFMNILVNAVQAISGRGKIDITLRELDGGVAVDIADDGCGMSEEVQLKVFDPFYTTKPPGVGTGLGLSITHTIVAAHNGRISIQSEEGKGATFSVWLPCTKD